MGLRPGWFKALLRGALPVLARAAVFIFAGPGIGGMVVLALTMASVGSDAPSSGLLVTALATAFAALVMLPFLVIASYMFGGLAAIVGGLVVAMVSPWIPYRLLRIVCAAIVGGAAAVIFQLDVTRDPNIPAAILAAAGAISAAICSGCVELIDRDRARRQRASVQT